MSSIRRDRTYSDPDRDTCATWLPTQTDEAGYRAQPFFVFVFGLRPSSFKRQNHTRVGGASLYSFSISCIFKKKSEGIITLFELSKDCLFVGPTDHQLRACMDRSISLSSTAPSFPSSSCCVPFLFGLCLWKAASLQSWIIGIWYLANTCRYLEIIKV